MYYNSFSNKPPNNNSYSNKGKHIGIVILLLVTFFGCQKNVSSDKESPNINLVSPRTDKCDIGKMVLVQAAIMDGFRIHTVHLQVTDILSNSSVIDTNINVDARTYTLYNSFVPADHTTYQIKIEAWDAGGNESKLQIQIKAS